MLFPQQELNSASQAVLAIVFYRLKLSKKACISATECIIIMAETHTEETHHVW